MKRLQSCLLLVFSFFIADIVFAQPGDFPESPPRISFGAGVATFRVSYDDFDQFFESKWGGAWGGHATIRLGSTINAVAKYRRFKKENNPEINGVTENLDWDEQWVNIGVRYMRFPDRGLMSFFGFGLAVFNIEGEGVRRVLPMTSDTEDGKISSNGFFLDFGVGYPLVKQAALTFEIEITSVGFDGSGSLESSSVGGIYIGAGLTVFPF